MSDAAQDSLKALLPYASPRNPADITAQAFNDPTLVATNLNMMLAEGTYDAIVAFFTFVAAAKAMVGPISETLRAAKRRHPDCLLVLSIVGPPDIVRHYEETGCPVFEDPSRAVRVVDALSRFSEAFARHTSVPAVPPAATPLPAPPIGAYAAKRILAEAGLPVVEEHLCTTADEAVSAATRLGFPVALKVASPGTLHKTEVGGVELGLLAADDVARAFAAVTGRARLARPDVRIKEVTVSRMVTGGVERILGVQDDQTFGPVVMFGLGGIFVETLKNVVFRVAPFEDDEAHRMMLELKGFAVLEGVRGHPRCDLDALAAALAALSRFAAAHADTLESAKLNPVIAFAEGPGLVALDALIVRKAGR